MKTKLLVSLASVACTALAFAAEDDQTAQFQVYPKNLARQHLGANLMQFNSSTNMFAPTQAAAAWLDDDVTTGWPLMAGKQYHLISLANPELVTNFSISTRPTNGTVSVYGSDVAAAPGASSWVPLLKDVPLDSVNQKLSRDFSRVSKYILLETDAANPGPVYSVYLYSHKPAVAYEVKKRGEAIQPKSVFGPYVNEATAFNVAGLYAHGEVTAASEGTELVSLQKAIDDNPETSISIAPGDKPTTIHLDRQHSISRVSVLSDPGTQGKLDLYLVDRDTPADAVPPTMTLVLDGTNPRASVDFPASAASEVRMKWTPNNGTDALTLREVNAFGETNLSTYAVAARTGSPAAVADRQLVADRGERKSRSDGKDVVDAKDAKDSKSAPEAVGAGPSTTPFLPGSLGFPPNINGRLPRDFPVSQ